MEATKMSLCDIFMPHINWYNYTEEQTHETFIQNRKEMKQSAANYVASLKVCYDWHNAVNDDVDALYKSHAHTFNRAKQQSYKDAIDEFLIEVRLALISHGYKRELRELHPLTLYRLGMTDARMKIYEGLSKSEAKKVYRQMKQQGFPIRAMWQEIWFADQYTVFGYKEPTCETKPHQSPLNVADGQLQRSDQNKPLEVEEMPINKDMLPTIGDEETKELEQRVFLKVIEAGFMSLNADNSGYKWEKSDYDLAFLCGCLYWGDCAREDKAKAYKSNFTKEFYYLEKNRKRIKRGKPAKIRKLFSGKNVNDDRDHYNELSQSPKWKEIDNLLKEAMAEVKAGK